MTGITLLVVAAAAGFGAARALRLPAIPFLLLAGWLLSLSGKMEAAFLQDALVLGVTFLVFAAGVELNPRRVRQQLKAAIAVALVQFIALGVVGFAAARLLGFDLQTSAYLALAITASSTLVVVRILQQRRQLFEPFGRLVIGVLLLQDLLVILLIPVVTSMGDGAGAALRGMASTLAMVGLAYALLRWVMPRLLTFLSLDEELLLLLVLALLFGFLFVAHGFGVPLVAGAFLAGVALSSFPVNGVVRGQLVPTADFFTAIFFTALGATLGFPSGVEVIQAVVLAAVVVVLTPPLVAWITERSGFSARPAIFSGLLLSQTSEFSLVVGIQGVVLGHIAPGTFTIIVLVTLGTMMLTPFLATDAVAFTLMRLHPARRVPATDDPPSGHVLLLGCGASGMPLLETLVIGPTRLVAVDDDPQIVALVREAGVEVIRGDAADPVLLRRAGAHQARVVISTIRRVEDNTAILSVATGVPVVVRTFDEAESEWVRERGGVPVAYAQATADSFMEWFDKRGWEAVDDLDAAELEDVL